MIRQQGNFRRTGRGGFTLIELLMVVTIIAMLGGMTIAVSKASIESARRAKTEMTIRKLDQIITSMYEKYQYRKVNVSDYMRETYTAYRTYRVYYNPWYASTNSPNYSKINDLGTPYYDLVALKTRWRLHVLRDTIRMDMPCCLAEILYGPASPTFECGANGYFKSSVSTATPQESYVNIEQLTNNAKRTRTALSALYYRAMAGKYFVDNAGIPASLTDVDRTYVNPELLYLMVTNGDPEARSLFTDKEIADVNNNGLFEFIDGWGKPIYWIRWAPGLPNDDRQTTEMVSYDTDGDGTNDYFEAAYPDPLNPLRSRVEFWQFDATTNYESFMLVPIVYSTGADNQHGIVAGLYSETDFNTMVTNYGLVKACQYILWWSVNPYSLNSNTGLPLNPAGQADGTSGAADNIHSHTVIR